MAHSKREYDRLQTKYANTYKRWRKVIGENKNLLRKLDLRNNTISQLKFKVESLKAREAKLTKSSFEKEAQVVKSQKNMRTYLSIVIALLK